MIAMHDEEAMGYRVSDGDWVVGWLGDFLWVADGAVEDGGIMR